MPGSTPIVPPNNMVEKLLRHIPGGQGTKVVVGTALIMGFLGATFFGGKSKKAGHGAFDVDKPQQVQEGQDKAETARLQRFQQAHDHPIKK